MSAFSRLLCRFIILFIILFKKCWVIFIGISQGLLEWLSQGFRIFMLLSNVFGEIFSIWTSFRLREVINGSFCADYGFVCLDEAFGLLVFVRIRFYYFLLDLISFFLEASSMDAE